MFTFPNTTFPVYSLASCSIMGEIILQGPHHGAQKSIRNRGYFDISFLKFESVRLMGSLILYMAAFDVMDFCNSTIFLCFIASSSSSSRPDMYYQFYICYMYVINKIIIIIHNYQYTIFVLYVCLSDTCVISDGY